MPSFGSGYRFHVTGLLHDAMGYPTQRRDEINTWIERTHRKVERNRAEIALVEEDGTGSANTVVVAYGSTARSARHAVKLARQHRHKVGLVTLLTLWPFPEQVIDRLGRSARRLIVPEMNLGQMGQPG
jgi:2-oxoglutarate ferredoxin oxidoreductase subunit alpha